MVDDTQAAENEDTQENTEEKTELEEMKERMEKRAKEEVDSKKEKPKEEPKDKEEKTETSEDSDESDNDEDSGNADEDDSQAEVSLDDDLIKRALDIGLPFSELKDMASKLSPEQLDRVLALAEKKSADAEGSTDEGSQEDEKKKFVDELMSKMPEFDDKWEDEVKQTFGQITEFNKTLAGAIFDLTGKVSALQEGSQQSSESLFIDGKIDALGKPYEELFGKGPASMLSDRSAKANREKLGRYLTFVNDEAEKAGEKLSAEEAFDRALSGAFNSHVLKVKGAEAARKSKERSKRATNAPRTSGREFAESGDTTTDKGTTDDRAFAAMQKVLKEKAKV